MDTPRLLAQTFLADHPENAAAIIERLEAGEAAAFFNQVPPRLAANTLRRMVGAPAAECLAALSPDRFAAILSLLPLDTAAGFFRRLDVSQQSRLLNQSPADIAPLLRRLLQYPEHTAGALMDPRVLALPDDVAVSEALTRVRRAPRHALYYLYVVDRTEKLVGVLNLRELMLASPKDMLASVMRRQVVAVAAHADRRGIVEHPGWRVVHALPVVDDQGTLLGVLRYETLRRLEEKLDAPAPTGGALSTVLNLGELCWVGLA
ncbi:MAG TPA: CBS domain-containing protein, partial [Afifellaceae bacterium]|nr:CBS domain-containing protein [Afifellaceae bacterium]